ncbi:Proteasome activator PA28 C-terminal domain-containing protein [Plasmodiophora brassicae]|uniref:Proteasome activator PA28 C-terminal domain-containing protein n=1 Tax=Plasmodiophora brassicae TaxID=37360 RepID=A0A0G4IJD0_PLABS|nr:hypothetical protein PBRA_003951 [Plasmodiophora brassicae]SPQ96366.1 unnamed protein product [Plasmodiophora brassicae]
MSSGDAAHMAESAASIAAASIGAVQIGEDGKPLELSALKASISEQAEHVIEKIMPRKVIRLTELYKNSKTSSHDALEVVKNGALANRGVTQLLEVLKVEILELIQYLDVLKLWVQLNIPSIQDGNNFGVSIQEEIAGMLEAGKNSGLGFLDTFTKYYATRGKLITKLNKYPNVDDYHRGIAELDEKKHLLLRHCCLDLRNNYAVLFDMITKNKDRLEKPRGLSNHISSMY